MNSDNAPLVNRLILLVLSLILVCLVMLVIRAYQEPAPPDAPAVAAEEQTPAIEEVPAPAEMIPVRRAEPPRRASPTNTARLVAARRPAPVPPPTPEVDFPSTSEQPAAASIAQFETVVAVRESVPAANVRDGSAASGQHGEITGIVTLSGTPKPEIPIDLGPTCGSHFPGQPTTRHFVVGPNGGLANVLVYLNSKGDITATLPPLDVPLLDQVGCMYEPYVMGVVVDQKFRVRNSDPVLHNVHSTPKSNHEFNLGQPLQGQVNERSFSTPELFIRVKCDVHPWMFAYISAVRHPFFAVTDTNGLFRLPAGLPSGGYTISAVHQKAGELSRRINLRDERPNTLNFQFSVPSVTQPQGRIARAE